VPRDPVAERNKGTVTGFTIADARRVQRDLDLMSTHVAYVSDNGLFFVMAHPQVERCLVVAVSASLESCIIHRWMRRDGSAFSAYGQVSCCFRQPGWYRINSVHEVKGLAL
jgi:hypothetical protein